MLIVLWETWSCAPQRLALAPLSSLFHPLCIIHFIQEKQKTKRGSWLKQKKVDQGYWERLGTNGAYWNKAVPKRRVLVFRKGLREKRKKARNGVKCDAIWPGCRMWGNQRHLWGAKRRQWKCWESGVHDYKKRKNLWVCSHESPPRASSETPAWLTLVTQREKRRKRGANDGGVRILQR